MAIVTIVGTARYPEDNAPIVNKKITFQAQQSFITGGILYVPHLIKVLTDAAGAFVDDGEVSLVVPDDSSEAVAYAIGLPNGTTLTVPLDSSMGTLTMADLWTLDGAAYVEPSVLSQYATTTALTTEATSRATADTALQQAVDSKADDAALLNYLLSDDFTWANLADKPSAFAPSAHAASHTTGSDSIADATTTTPGLMGAADKTKLDGVASGATANSADSYLLNRANHTGTQLAATISDLTTSVQSIGASRYVRYDAAQGLTTPQQTQARSNVGSAAQVAHGRVVLLGQTYYSIPGVEAVLITTLTVASNQVRYAGIVVSAPIAIDQLACEVTTAGTAGTTARMGIYSADTAWMPTSLIADGGTVAVDTTGVKTAAVSATLAPGRYLTAFNTNGAPTLRSVRGGAAHTGYAYTLGAAPVIFQLSASQTYGAFPATPTAPDTLGGAGSGMAHVVWLRISG